MKIEEGMYVRFDNVICKILEIEDGMIEFDEFFYDHWNESICNMEYNRFVKDYKPKTSHNIIDLVEVGDYVNGWKVIEKDYNADEEKYIRVDKNQAGLKTILFNFDIKSIVTKEMYESMEYRIGE